MGSQLTLPQILGGLLVFGGVALSALRGRRAVSVGAGAGQALEASSPAH